MDSCPDHAKKLYRTVVFLSAPLLLLGLSLLAGNRVARAADLLTARYDNARTGQNLSETTLTPQNVNPTSFGKLFSLTTDGEVYAQPLYKSQVAIPNQGIHNVLYVATEHGSVYAFDADGNNPAPGYLWKVSFINPAIGITPVLPSDVTTPDITPELVITGTPVIDASSNTIYVVAQTKEQTGGKTSFVFRLHALDLATGAEKMNGPVVIQGSIPGTGNGSVNGVLAFDTLFENQRAGLVLVNGKVYVPFGAHGDKGNFHGWVFGYNASNVQQQAGIFVTTPNGWGGGIWMGGGAVSSDSVGNLYVGAGNGQFGTGNQSGNQNYADSLLRLSTTAGLQVTDSFTPASQQALEFADDDMGVSDLLLLPDQAGVYPHMLVTADKTGALYVVDRDAFGGFNPTVDNDIQTVKTGASLHNSISYFNNRIYVGGDGAGVQAYQLQNGVLSGTPQSITPNIFGQNRSGRSGTSPIITANGDSGGILWALDVYGGPAVLYAYDASNLWKMLYSSNQAPNQRDVAGAAVKFTTPSVINGKVYVEGSSSVTVYGPLSEAGPPTVFVPAFNPAPGKIFNDPQSVALSDATPGSTIYYTTDGTAPSTNSAIYSSPIQISGPTTITAFATAPGANPSASVSAFYTVQSSSTPPVPTFSSGFSTAGLALNGVASVVGSKLQLTDGGDNEASSAFYTTPVNVQRFATHFLFQLNNPNSEGFTFTIQNSGLTALGSPGGGLGYGPDPNYHASSYEYSVSNSVAVKFDLTNTSGEGVDSTGLFTNGAAPVMPSIDLSTTGIDLHSGDTFMASMDYDGSNLTLTITDTNNPAKTYSKAFAIDIPGTIGSKTAYVGFTGSTSVNGATQSILQWDFASLPNFSTGFNDFGLALNGTASVVGTRLQLTDNVAAQAGSAYYATPLNIRQFTTDFLFQLTSAEADGFTFVIQRSGAGALGNNGGDLGYAPNISNSVAVKFDLYDNGGEGPSSTGLYKNGADPIPASIDLSSHGIDLHSGDTFRAHLDYDGANLALTITDVNAPSKTFSTKFAVDIPGTVGGTTAFVGFTGGTGGGTAKQQILQWSFSPLAGSAPTAGPAATPVFNPPSGTIFNGPQSVTLSDATPGSTVYYTTDGSAPSTSSAAYSSPIQVNGPTQINAFAAAPGYTASPVAAASYTIQSNPSSSGSGPQFGNGFTTAGLALNGAASVTGTRLQLTDGGSAEAGSAFYATPVNIQRFTTDFLFQLTNPQGDGFTFTIQGSGPNALGSNGGGLGYGPGINQSVAVKFDLYDNGGEGSSSTGLYINGAGPTIPSTDLLSHGIDLHSGHTFHAQLSYDGTNVALTITDTNNPSKTFSTSFAINIPGTVGGTTAYVGFTGGTGGATATQQILQWNFTPGSTSVLPSGLPSFGNGFTTAGLTLNGSASVAATRLQLTDGGSAEAGSAFYGTPVNIQRFTTDFLFQLTNPQGDGLTFTIQRSGPNALGSNGGGLGYGPGINQSVAVKFDLYDNGGEGSSSTGLYINGTGPTIPSTDLLSHGIDLHSGDTFHAQLSYDGTKIALTITDTNNPANTFSTSFAIDIPGTVGGTTAYVGFTGGTGGATAIQQILQWSFGN
jgi:hypothetical protein